MWWPLPIQGWSRAAYEPVERAEKQLSEAPTGGPRSLLVSSEPTTILLLAPKLAWGRANSCSAIPTWADVHRHLGRNAHCPTLAQPEKKACSSGGSQPQETSWQEKLPPWHIGAEEMLEKPNRAALQAKLQPLRLPEPLDWAKCSLTLTGSRVHHY